MTVCNMPRPGSTDANGSMPIGKKPGTMKGIRAGFLGAGLGPDKVGTVTAGTLGGATGPGKGGTVMSTSTAPKGRDKSTTLVDAQMRIGDKASTGSGKRGTYL